MIKVVDRVGSGNGVVGWEGVEEGKEYLSVQLLCLLASQFYHKLWAWLDNGHVFFH